jgi:uncharacterized protein YneF (UPF0154 family)
MKKTLEENPPIIAQSLWFCYLFCGEDLDEKSAKKKNAPCKPHNTLIILVP